MRAAEGKMTRSPGIATRGPPIEEITPPPGCINIVHYIVHYIHPTAWVLSAAESATAAPRARGTIKAGPPRRRVRTVGRAALRAPCAALCTRGCRPTHPGCNRMHPGCNPKYFDKRPPPESPKPCSRINEAVAPLVGPCSPRNVHVLCHAM